VNCDGNGGGGRIKREEATGVRREVTNKNKDIKKRKKDTRKKKVKTSRRKCIMKKLRKRRRIMRR